MDNEKIIIRMNMLGGMDAYIRNIIGDDNVTELWDMFGVPDGADEPMVMEIAEDDHEWARICGYFGIIVRRLEMEAEE